MEEKKQLAFRFEIWEKLLERKTWVMYLQPPFEFALGKLEELFTLGRFNKVTEVINKYTKAFMVNGVEPPPAIAGAIKNFADDIASGREVVVRAGDYIAIHNFMRAQKKAE